MNTDKMLEQLTLNKPAKVLTNLVVMIGLECEIGKVRLEQLRNLSEDEYSSIDVQREAIELIIKSQIYCDLIGYIKQGLVE